MTTPADSDDGFTPGSLVGGRLRVEAQLGRGGMAAVHRVLDERSGRKLALKHLRTPREDSAVLLRTQFEREYHTLCQLAHPRIIEVYDYGVERGSAYYTMELLDGEDLHARGRLPWRTACALFCDIASSLAILHSRRLVHRDLSARNVRCTSDGRAKLIDFGAMSAMGAARNIVGTPPFVPPEALQLQALDGRADLYGLGALAYWTLTGYHAYHARSFNQLRELWRCPPLALRMYDEELPQALDDLVLALVQLDRDARPARAAEVMERLSGIAGLPLPELPEVSRAYLVMPRLIGRTSLVQEVRQSLAASSSSWGKSFLLQGEAGAGRSRLLQACVLEAKLMGIPVLRADAEDGRTEYGVARALLEQLRIEQPALHEDCDRDQRALLDFVLGRDERAAGAPAPGRRQLQTALRNFVLSAARTTPVVIAVDDIEATDEPSAALLAALAVAAAHTHLTLLVTCVETPAPSQALALLQKIAHKLTLRALDDTQTEGLLRSVFGDVDHVAPLAERIQRIAHGNPRSTMALCERLVERRVARYEAGGWSLPSVLDPEDLPDSLTQALEGRLAALGGDARELAECLSLTDPAALRIADYPALTEHGDHGRVHRALDELIAREVLVVEGERSRFAQDELGRLLQSRVDPLRAPALHGRLAEALRGHRDRVRLAHHLLCSGREREAIALFLEVLREGRFLFTRRALDLLERALAAAERLRLPLLNRMQLRVRLLGAAALQGKLATYVQHAPVVLDRLMHDSGLAEYAALPTLPEGERLATAQARARQRHDQAPEAERGYAPREAAEQLGLLALGWSAMALVAQDLPLLQRFPSLAPLQSVALEVELAVANARGASYQLTGQYAHVRDTYQKVLDLTHVEYTGLHNVTIQLVRAATLYVLGLFAAGGGQRQSREFLAELQQDPRLRVHAWRVRMAYELSQGNTQAASACQRRAELLQLQDGEQLILPGTTLRVELMAHVLGEDLLGVKRSVAQLEPHAQRYPGWRPTLALARCAYLRLKGDHEGALAALMPGLQSTAPGQHQDWGPLAGMHVDVLTRLGRADQAVERGREYMSRSQHGTSPGHFDLLLPMAAALIANGEIAAANELIERYVRVSEAIGTRGLRLALGYEARARLAIAMRDEAALKDYATRCALEYKAGSGDRNLMLNAKYERLMREAEAAGLNIPTTHIEAPVRFERTVARNATAARTDSQLVLEPQG